MKNSPPRGCKRLRINAISVAKLMRALQLDACTLHELVDETGMALCTCRSYVKALHAEGGCHIVGWEKDGRGRHTTPVWRAGEGRDMPRPSLKPAQRAAQYRARRRLAPLMAIAT